MQHTMNFRGRSGNVTFVIISLVETNVHYPTDINLLLDAVRKVITLTADYAGMTGLGGWRQSVYHCRQVKRAHR